MCRPLDCACMCLLRTSTYTCKQTIYSARIRCMHGRSMIYCNTDAMLVMLYPQDGIIIKNTLLRTLIYTSQLGGGGPSMHVHVHLHVEQTNMVDQCLGTKYYNKQVQMCQWFASMSGGGVGVGADDLYTLLLLCFGSHAAQTPPEACTCTCTCMWHHMQCHVHACGTYHMQRTPMLLYASTCYNIAAGDWFVFIALSPIMVTFSLSYLKYPIKCSVYSQAPLLLCNRQYTLRSM